MDEIELKRRVKYAGDVHAELMKAGWDCCTAAEFLNNIPDADIAPVRHGRWGTNSDIPDSLICSVCNCGFDMWKHDPHNYCPNCGAKMDGDE